MQVKDLIVTGDAKIIGNLYTKDGLAGGGSSGGGSSDGSGLTYKLSKSGNTITLTGSDGSTSSVQDENNDTNTTYTFATGDGNGQIKVTPSNGSAQNVAVKGLGSAAYTASTAYAAASHGTHVSYGTSATAVGSTASAGSASTVSRSDHTHSLSKSAVTTALGYTPPTQDTTYSVVSTTADGLAPKRDGSTTKFLRADGTCILLYLRSMSFRLSKFNIFLLLSNGCGLFFSFLNKSFLLCFVFIFEYQ